jgi:hypothetical protein
VAAILYPHVDHDVKRARDVAEELIAAVQHLSERRELARRFLEADKDYQEGIKFITGEDRLPRAIKKYNAFLDRHKLTGMLVKEPINGAKAMRTPADWQGQGFASHELEGLKELFNLTKKIKKIDLAKKTSCVPQKPRNEARKPKKPRRKAKN